MTVFIDTHCHIDRYANPPRVLEAAASLGVVTVSVTELPSRFQRLDLALRGSPRLRLALGLHPLRAASATAMELRLFSRLLDRTSYVGEVGLDFSREGSASRHRQIEVFERLLAEPGITRKVLSVHTRRADADSLLRLRQAGVHAILHWYSGPLKYVDEALSDGRYFSVNPSMLRTSSGARLLEALPRDRVLTETDGPYTKVIGRPAQPKDVPWLIEQIAQRWGVPPAAAGEQIAKNFRTLVDAAAASGGPS